MVGPLLDLYANFGPWLNAGLNFVAFGIGLALLATGAENQSSCPMEPKIPLYLLVQGITLIFLTTLTCFSFFKGTMRGFSKVTELILCSVLLMLSLFSLAWLIAGSVWIYGNQSVMQSTNPATLSTYCDKQLYIFSYAINIILIVAIVPPLVILTCLLSIFFIRKP